MLSPPMMSFRSFLLPVSLSALLVSCGSTPLRNNVSRDGSNYLAGLGVTSSLSNPPANPAEASKFWDGDSIQGTPAIRINRREQKAYFYKSGELVGVTPISSGNDGHTTPDGNYKVTQKTIDHKSSVYGIIVNNATGETVNDDADTRLHKPGPGETFVHAPMPFFLRFNHGIGMHAGYLPGYAASHGCVRLPRDMAQKFFEHASVGTPVIVE
jgi:hypothetical protein